MLAFYFFFQLNDFVGVTVSVTYVMYDVKKQLGLCMFYLDIIKSWS